MFALDWLTQPAYGVLTLALLHFVWQGLAIALALVGFVELCNVRRATSRYACSLVALLAVALSPVATIAWLALSRPPDAINGSALFDTATHSVINSRAWTQWLEMAQPYVLIAWLGGVALFGGRLLAGVAGVARLRRGRLPLPLEMKGIVERLGRRLHMNALPLVFLSRQVADAMAVGLIRPLVLIPASWATEMPLEILEAVIAHELAHLRRCDLWVNLLQRIVETLLFYHPVVWWLSRRLRIERELCADELAVAATGKRLEYARALEQIAGERQADIRPALAAFLRGETYMRLLQRVRNVLNQPASERSRLWPAGIIALALPLGLWAAAAMSGVAIADDDEPRKPAVKRERGDGEKETRIVIRKDKEAVEDKNDGKGEEIEERIVRYRIARPGQPPRDEIVEERVIKRDGKPVYEVQLGRDDKGDRRIDELTALVKKLAGQVERLQDEVKQLRGGRIEGKRSINVPAMGPAPLAFDFQNKFESEERSQLDARKRELQLAAEKIEATRRALAQKEEAFAAARRQEGEAKERAIKQEIEKAVMEKVRAAEEKAREGGEKKERVLLELRRAKELKEEAARDKASGELKELEKKLKSLKERKEPTAQEEIDGEQLEVELRRKERDRQSLLK